MALLEAGLASLPVIATKVGGIPDIVTDHVSGLFMPRSNTHIMSLAIAHLLNNPNEAKRLGENLHKKVSTEFSEEKMVEKTFALY